jgi:hypothetical protein
MVQPPGRAGKKMDYCHTDADVLPAKKLGCVFMLYGDTKIDWPAQ